MAQPASPTNASDEQEPTEMKWRSRTATLSPGEQFPGKSAFVDEAVAHAPVGALARIETINGTRSGRIATFQARASFRLWSEDWVLRHFEQFGERRSTVLEREGPFDRLESNGPNLRTTTLRLGSGP